MNVLLTGVTGFLGGNLARSFIEQGYKVVGLKRKSSDLVKINNLLTSGLLLYDVDDPLDSIFRDNFINVVVHTATNYGKSCDDVTIINDNELFPLKILQYAVNNDISFINTHSSLPILANSYSVSKNNFLTWAKYLSTLKFKQAKFINVVLEHFYGYGDGRFIEYLIKSILNNVDYIDLTFGEQQRDFIYINDVVGAYVTILKNMNLFADKYTDIPLGSAKTIMIKELAILIKNTINNDHTELRFGAIPYRQDELMYSCADISIMASLGWYPQYNLEQGLLECIENYSCL